jgi:hypothetical protein
MLGDAARLSLDEDVVVVTVRVADPGVGVLVLV